MALRRFGVSTCAHIRAASFALSITLVPACSSNDAAPVTGAPSCPTKAPLLEADCDPIGGFCGLPFPSNVYLKNDPTGKSLTGKRLEFGPGTLPATHKANAGDGTAYPLDPSMFYGFDGFSPASAPMIYIEDATAEGLPTPADLGARATRDALGRVAGQRTWAP